MILLALLWGCSGDDDGPMPHSVDTGVEPVACEMLTWNNTAQPFVTTWCTACHSSSLDAGARYGAPVAVNLDRYDDVLALASRVAITAVGPDARMPPVGGADNADKALFARWLECGLPGPPPPDDVSCDDAVDVSTFTVCGAELLHITGDAVVQNNGDCVCGVDGHLTASGPLPVLAAVGGDFVVAGAIDAPMLLSVGGELRVSGEGEVLLPRLTSADQVYVGGNTVVLDLHDLETVPGDVRLEGNAALKRVDLSRLADVGGTLALVDNAVLEVVLGEGYALRHLGGDLLLQNNPFWVGFYGFGLLEDVGGDIVVSAQDRFIVINGFTALQSVGGDVRIVSNPSLIALEGFDQLLDVQGELVVSDNRKLGIEDAFGQLDRVGGAVVVSGNTVLVTVDGLVGVGDVGGVVWSSNPAISDLGTYLQLRTVRGDLSFRDMGSLQGLQGFAGVDAIDGALLIEDNPVLLAVPGFASLRDVAGRVEVVDNPQLQGLVGPQGIAHVGEDLRLLSNPQMSEAQLASWLSTVVVDGDVELSENAP